MTYARPRRQPRTSPPATPPAPPKMAGALMIPPAISTQEMTAAPMNATDDPTIVINARTPYHRYRRHPRWYLRHRPCSQAWARVRPLLVQAGPWPYTPDTS